MTEHRLTSADALAKAFSFPGRMSRRTYWLHVGALFAAGVSAAGWQLAAPDLPVVHLTLMGALVLAWLRVGILRMHDIGRSGKVGALGAALFLLGPIFLGGLLLALVRMTGPAPAPWLAVLLVSATFLVSLLCVSAVVVWAGTKPGQPHPNRYGPPPEPWLNEAPSHA